MKIGIFLIAATAVGYFWLLPIAGSYSRQKAHDVAVEKIASIANAKAKAGTISEDFQKVLGVEKLPRVNLPAPLGIASPKRFEVVMTEWGGVIGESEEDWEVVTESGRRIRANEFTPEVRRELASSRESSLADLGLSLLSSMRTAKSEKKILLILSPRLEPMLEIISSAASSGGKDEFVGLNIIVVSDQDNESKVRSAFAKSGATAYPVSYR